MHFMPGCAVQNYATPFITIHALSKSWFFNCIHQYVAALQLIVSRRKADTRLRYRGYQYIATHQLTYIGINSDTILPLSSTDLF